MFRGISWRRRTGSPWAAIPERYGPSTTCYNPFVRWAKIGVRDRIFEAISRAYDGDLQMIDSSAIRVRQHGANGKGGSEETPPAARDLAQARCLGRDKNGANFGSKPQTIPIDRKAPNSRFFCTGNGRQ